MDLNLWLRRLWLILANAFIPVACYVFATGFFPYKPFLPGLATFEQQDAGEELRLLTDVMTATNRSALKPQRAFDKVVFMVVDALRRFVHPCHSPYKSQEDHQEPAQKHMPPVLRPSMPGRADCKTSDCTQGLHE